MVVFSELDVRSAVLELFKDVGDWYVAIGDPCRVQILGVCRVPVDFCLFGTGIFNAGTLVNARSVI